MPGATEIMPIEELKDRLSPLFTGEGLRLALLFGSAATGKTHKRSDIDLAFLFDKPVDILSLTNKVTRLLHADNVDVIDLRRASPLLRYSAIRHGKLLYEREKGMYHEYYSLAFRIYIDTKKLRDAQVVFIENFLKSRGFS